MRTQVEELETEMDGYAGMNWRDEYPGYNRLDWKSKLEVLEAALDEYRED